MLQGTAGATVLLTEQAAGLQVHSYPNPSTGYFTLQWQCSRTEPVSIRVVDNLGRSVESRTNLAANGSVTIGQRYRTGVYFVEVVQGTEKTVLKLKKR
ncbi:MAG: T9SS type A sorting domain-containing protein [Flavisolibacter sp.]|nr:T9SS type A sorting domain-containing protein [Flavisolibacter sp.]